MDHLTLNVIEKLSSEDDTLLYPGRQRLDSGYGSNLYPINTFSPDVNLEGSLSIFKPLDRPLTPYEDFAIFRIAQKLAALQIKLTCNDTPKSNIATSISKICSSNDFVGLPSSSSVKEVQKSGDVAVKSKRKSGMRKAPKSYCQFCQNNEEVRCRPLGLVPDSSVWMDHRLKDEDGNCACPKLRAHTCEFCGQNGDQAHTIRYCEAKRRQKLKFV